MIDNDVVVIPKGKRPRRHPGKRHLYTRWKWLAGGKVQFRQCLRPRCPYTGVRRARGGGAGGGGGRGDRRARRRNAAPPWAAGAAVREKRSVGRRLDDAQK
jgi:hypothetical protein